MADSLRNEKERKKACDEVIKFRRILDRQRTASLPEEDQQKLKARFASLEAECQEKEKKVEDGISQLIKSSSWPIASQPGVEEGGATNAQEVIKYLAGLTDKASEMYKVLIDIRERTAPPAHSTTTDMDVDPQGGSSRPLKRRRLSDTAPPAQSQPASPKELDSIRDRLMSIEARFSTFRNDLDAHNAEQADMMKELLETKLDALQLHSYSIPTVPQDKLHEIEENIGKTGADMDELAKEITELITQTATQASEVTLLRSEIETSKSSFKEVRESMIKFTHTSLHNNGLHV
jgi:hypothetical protein